MNFTIAFPISYVCEVVLLLHCPVAVCVLQYLIMYMNTISEGPIPHQILHARKRDSTLPIYCMDVPNEWLAMYVCVHHAPNSQAINTNAMHMYNMYVCIQLTLKYCTIISQTVLVIQQSMHIYDLYCIVTYTLYVRR